MNPQENSKWDRLSAFTLSAVFDSIVFYHIEEQVHVCKVMCTYLDNV